MRERVRSIQPPARQGEGRVAVPRQRESSCIPRNVSYKPGRGHHRMTPASRRNRQTGTERSVGAAGMVIWPIITGIAINGGDHLENLEVRKDSIENQSGWGLTTWTARKAGNALLGKNRSYRVIHVHHPGYSNPKVCPNGPFSCFQFQFLRFRSCFGPAWGHAAPTSRDTNTYSRDAAALRQTACTRITLKFRSNTRGSVFQREAPVEAVAKIEPAVLATRVVAAVVAFPR